MFNPYSMLSRNRRRRGTTLIEVIVASSLMLVLSSMVMAAMIYYLRALSVLRTRADLAEQSRNTQRELNYAAASATSLTVGDNGNRLTMTFPTGSTFGATRVYQYVDADNNNNTTINNQLLDTTDAANPRTIARGIARIITPGPNTAIPIFFSPATSSHVEVSLRFGDTQNTAGAPSDAVTGPGFQTYAMRTGLVVRN